MFINPKLAIENGWIKGLVNEEKQVQPNAIDFTIDKLFTVSKNEFIISEEGKQMRGGNALLPVTHRRTGVDFWHLNPHEVYDGMSDVYVTVPDGVACMLVPRSTFTRNGIFLTSGLYDSGFEGHIGFTLHNRGSDAKVAPGTRVGQIIFVESENALQYSGGYNHELGTNAHQE